MNNIIESILKLKTSSFFNDVISIFFGYIFLLCVNPIFKLDLIKYLNVNQYGGFAIYFATLAGAFIIGKILYMIGTAWMNIFYFLFDHNRFQALKDIWHEFQERAEHNLKSHIPLKNNPKNILRGEMGKQIESSFLTKESYDRNYYNKTFNRALAGLVLFFIFFVSPLFLFVLLVITIFCIGDDLRHVNLMNEIGIAVERSKSSS